MARQQKHTIGAGRGGRIPVIAGDQVEVINVSGTQVVDFWCFPKSSPQQYLSLEHCREVLGKIYFSPGDVLVSNTYDRVFEYLSDTTGGLHDTLIAPCNPEMYRRFGRPEGHPSCTGNFQAAIAEAGIAIPFVPSPWNLFMRARVGTDGGIVYERPPFIPHGKVVLRLLVDATIIVSSCPDDCYPTNGGDGSPRDFEVLVHHLG